MPIKLRNPNTALLQSEKYHRLNNPKVERWLFDTWNAQGDSMRLNEIRAAMDSGDINPEWLSRWRKDYFKFVNNDLGPQWKDAMKTNGEYTINGLNKAMALRKPLIWNDEAAAISNWLGDNGARLLTQVTGEQRQAVSTLIHQFTVNQPMGAMELSRVLRPTVGLNGPQAAALAKYRQSLLDADTPRARIEELVNKKTIEGIVSRSEMIAQTELSFAYHAGADIALQQAIEEGAFLDDQFVVKVWLCNPGCCVFCQAINGEKRPLDDYYIVDPRTGKEIYRPPYHPRCICTQYNEVLTEEEYNALVATL
jgi:hypothetical protein